LALGAVVLPDASASRSGLATLQAVSVLCMGHHAPGQGDTAPHRHVSDPALCPLSVALAVPGAILTPFLTLPAPSSVVASRIRTRPPGRGPPPETARVGKPRGPPVTG
jgi:hypothetical protein